MTVRDDSLSVVICAYTEERWADIVAAVASVAAQEPPVLEIIVVTDHNDALLARARSEIAGAKVVANAEAKGLSGARNTGIAAAAGTVVAFLDDDATATPGWAARLLAAYADPRVLGAGGRVVPSWDEGRPTWLPEEFDWVVGCTYAGHRDAPGPVRNLIGANMSVRRAVVDEIGGFRHSLGRTATLPAGCEETELFIRASQRFPDGIVWYDPDAAVHHRVPATRATAKYFRARCFAEGVSKTQISRLVGTRDGLASERAYTTRALPRAVLRELGRAARTLDASGVARAATVMTGVATTASGYAAARVPGSQRWLPSRAGAAPSASAPPEARPFEPARVIQVDIADPVPGLSALDPVRGTTYGRAVVLVRRNRAPIGVLELTFGPHGLTAAEHAAAIERALGITVATPGPEVVITRGTANGNGASPAGHRSGNANGNGNGNGHTADGNGHGATNGSGQAPHVAVVRERPAASVVIATRDRAESLARCLESLRHLDHPASEIVVVDNASAGRDTADLVRSLHAADPRFRYTREERPGLARAHNCGLELATEPLVAFTDDDVVVDPGWLGQLVEGFGRQPNVGCVTGMIFPLELETAAQDWLEHYAGFNKGFEPRIFELARQPADPLFPYTAGTFGSGANMAFRADVLRAMRGFEPALGAGTEAKGGDDLAAFFDVIAAGHAIAYEPGAIVYHEHHRTFGVLARQTFGYGAGLTAYLTKTILEQPNRVFDMMGRAPKAAHHALSPRSAKNERLPLHTPPTLVRQERLGMLAGPALFLLSRWDTRFDPRPGPSAPTNSDGAGADVDLVEAEWSEASVRP